MSIRNKASRKAKANHQLVFDALKSARRPLSAYDLIGQLKDAGIKAPPTVYRALTRLVDEKRAHRLESLNAFVACTHDHSPGASAVFAICDNCGNVDELVDNDVAAKLARRAAAKSFTVKSTTIELRGTCGECRDSAP